MFTDDSRWPDLPIRPLLSEIAQALSRRDELVLQAAPGAGKTTLVPLALLDQPWLAGRKILMLEPRRMAARAAAQRMAELLGERAGQRVGYRVRQESRVGSDTRIEVITEGILTRMLLDDPALEQVGLLIFDEFHERSLDADLGLALALQAREYFRQPDAPLKLLLMSATLDGEALAQWLNAAPLISAAGRQYPVQTTYLGAVADAQALLPAMQAAIMRALREQGGSILAFLPGQAEIHRLAERLAAQLPGDVELAPLYGELSLEQQRRAIAPPAPGRRKLVLATDIAESSLTIEGVTVVVDSGYCRVPRYDPKTAMSRLHTQRIAQDSAAQRQGRAGRLQPGSCYRLWAAEQLLSPRRSAEILQADLSALVLQLLSWGVSEPTELRWLDMPPPAAVAQARALLQQLGAIVPRGETSSDWQLSESGRQMAALALHPRLAHMLLVGANYGCLPMAAALAALLQERDPLRDAGADLALRLQQLERASQRSGTWQRIARQAEQLQQQCQRLCARRPDRSLPALSAAQQGALLLASAYPDRIARRRDGDYARYQLSNGRSARLPEDDPLCSAPWLVVAELGGHAGAREDRIYRALALDEALLLPAAGDAPLQSLLCWREHSGWDDQQQRLLAERRCYLGELLLRSERLPTLSLEQRSAAMLSLIAQRGLALLPWNEALLQWRARVQLLHTLFGAPWPDLSDAALLAGLADWLLPWLDGIDSLARLQRVDLAAALQALLPWPLPQQLDALAPTHWPVPSGSRIAIDYRQSPPVLAVKLQEMFGATQTPLIAGGRQPLLLHLLSPARRPLQVTQDLAAFWVGAYAQVKKEMKGRYPKHPWPDDPLQALPTRHTKARSGQS